MLCQGACKRLWGINHGQRLGRQQRLGNITEVLQRRPTQHGLTQCGRLQHIMPAQRHQAATHIGHAPRAVQRRQLAQRIAQVNLGGGCNGLLLATATDLPALALAQCRHLVKALRVARHQHQQCVWKAFEQLPVGRKQQRFFPIAGRARDPDGSLSPSLK